MRRRMQLRITLWRIGALALVIASLAGVSAIGPTAAGAASPTGGHAARGALSAPTQTAAARTDYGPVKAAVSRYIRSLMAENRTAGLAIALVDGLRVVWT